MSKFSKYIITALFCLIMLFGFGRNVKAYDLKCADPAPGFKNAVFLKTTNPESTGKSSIELVDGTTTDPTIEPVEGAVYCVQIGVKRNEVVFEDMLPSGLFVQEDANKIVYPQWYTECGINGWTEDIFTDDKLVEQKFALSRYRNRRCLVGILVPGESTWYKDRFRYRIKKVGDDDYLYFMGVDMGGGVAGPIPNKTCWDSDETTCKGQYKDQCFWYPIPNVHNCQARIDPAVCGSLPENYCGEEKKIGSYACVWNKAENKCLTILKDSVQQNYGRPEGYTGPLPTCAFSGDCDNVNEILQLVVNFAWGGLLSIIGGAAFIMFVWAGFTIILSFGNPEKVKKGWHMMISDIIGMAIAFGAYLLIDFILTTLDVPASLRGIGR